MALLPVPVGSIAAVVTHLDMTEPPTRPRLPAPRAGLALVRVPAPDLEWYRALYRAVGEDWLWFSRLELTDAQLGALLGHPQVAVYALCDGCREIGLVELDWRQAPDCEIVFFGLVPGATGQGLGGWAMDQVQRLAFAEGATRLWLHTCTLDHPRALPFYMAAGFRPFRREVEIVPDPRLFGDIRRDAAPFHPVIAPP